MEGEDYKLADAGSIAKKIESSEWPFWKKTLLFLSLGVLLILILIIIIVVISSKSENKEDSIDESKVTGDIKCEYDISSTSESTQILGNDYNKTKLDIVVDNKTFGFLREIKFPQTGIHTIRFVFYEKEINLNYMFKGVKSLISVEMNSTKNLEINSMISTFEECENLEKFNISGYNTSKVKSIHKLFYGVKNLNYMDFDLFSENIIEDMSYLFAMSSFVTIDLSKLNTNKAKNMSQVTLLKVRNMLITLTKATVLQKLCILKMIAP